MKKRFTYGGKIILCAEKTGNRAAGKKYTASVT
jgi:hypothetical protein